MAKRDGCEPLEPLNASATEKAVRVGGFLTADLASSSADNDFACHSAKS